MSEAIDLAKLQAEFVQQHDLLVKAIGVANDRTKDGEKMRAEDRSAIENLSTKSIDLADRCVKMEQRISDILNNLAGTPNGGNAPIDIGKQFTESDGFKHYAEQLLGGAGMLNSAKFRMQFKTAIINAVGQNQPLVPAQHLPGIVAPPRRSLRMRDVLAVGRTSSNAVEFPKETAFTNNAGPQISGSPQAFENVVKPESAITFELATYPVCTVAHWIPVSKQILADAPALQAYINNRLSYGLKLKEDTEILLGTGLNGRIHGLYTDRTAYSVPSPTVYTTKLDVLRDAIKQAQIAEYDPNAIVLNSSDWSKIELAKDSTGRYLFANPQNAAQPALWGLPVVVSNSITAGTFLLGSFDQAAMLWDREDMSVEVGLNNDNFTRNMVTILCEERICLTVFRATAIIGGAFLA
jgi:HK97 family phage major capsid protein